MLFAFHSGQANGILGQVNCLQYQQTQILDKISDLQEEQTNLATRKSQIEDIFSTQTSQWSAAFSQSANYGSQYQASVFSQYQAQTAQLTAVKNALVSQIEIQVKQLTSRENAYEKKKTAIEDKIKYWEKVYESHKEAATKGLDNFFKGIFG